MYEKTNFKDWIDEKPNEYFLNGEKVIIEKCNEAVKQQGTLLSADILNYIDTGVWKNANEIKKIIEFLSKVESEFEIFKKNFDNIDIPVRSVNGKKGAVKLTIDDIEDSDKLQLSSILKKIQNELSKKIDIKNAKVENNNESLETAQLRNIFISNKKADINKMKNGDIWLEYEEGV